MVIIQKNKWKLNIKLKRPFETKTGEYIYDLVEKNSYSL